MNAVKQSFDRSCLRTDLPRGPLLVHKKNLKKKIALAFLLALSGLSTQAQTTAPGCDLPSSASGSTGGGIGFNFGSVNTPANAIDGDANTRSVMSAFFSAGFGVNWTLNTQLNGLYSGDVYIKCATDGSVFAANIAGNVTLTAFNGSTQVWQVNVGNTVASWGITFGNGTEGIVPAPNTTAYNRLEVKMTSSINFSPIGDIFSVYELKRVPFLPAAPAVSGSGTTISSCFPAAANYTVNNPSASLVYKWYNAASGGTLLATGTSYSTAAALPAGTNTVYVEAVAANNCVYPTQRVSTRTAASVTVTICDSDGDGVANSADLDDDNDGIPDTLEGYNASNPSASRDTDGDGIADYIDLDSDNDGINDVREAGGTDANNDGRADGSVNANGIPASAGTNGLTPVDSDSDGKPNAYDLDSDNDGITDLKESGNTALVDANNDGKVDGTVDTDKDGIIGTADGSPAVWGDASDPVLADTDGDGVANIRDLDSDNDGITDVREAGGTDANGDGKADGTVNATTGIPSSAGTGLATADADGDGISNDKDLDSDNDGIADLKEGNPALADANNDGKVDGTDTDGDGIVGAADGAPSVWGDANDPALLDSDGDGVPNIRDLDSDNDGINDVKEAGGTDANGDGKADGTVNPATGIAATAGTAGLAPIDADGDGVTNDKDLDSDNDGITDIRENGGTDANNDGMADGTDADGDGIVSGVDGTPNAWGDSNDPAAIDTDGDGKPDYKDLDSDNDGKSDLVESGNPAAIAGDINNDGVIDFNGNDPDGDGILTPADGTPTFGTNTPAPVDSDSDGIADYKDPVTGTTQDIDNTPYSGLDTNNDGVINGSDTGGAADADGDGIPDIIDADDTVFGGLPSNIGIAAKAFLRGAFNGTRHKDVTTAWLNVLRANALAQPYNTAAFGNYTGTESVTAAVFTATAADNDALDWVLLELKKADGTLVDRRAAFILENGNIVGTDKVSPVYFKAFPGNYHLTIRHRNHLGLSTELISLAAAGSTFDFTTATDATLFGTSAAFTTMSGKTLLFGGNANSNVNVRYNGPANDRDAILAFLGANEVGLTSSVYTAIDVNLDGTVRYNGPNNDRDFLLLMLGANETGFVQQQIK